MGSELVAEEASARVSPRALFVRALPVLRETCTLFGLILLSETLHLVMKDPAFLSSLGWSSLPVLACYAAVAVAVAVGASFLNSALVRSFVISSFVFVLLSLKALAIDASFLHHISPALKYAAVCATIFASACWLARKAKLPSLLPLMVLVLFNSLKWLGHSWALRGGDINRFLLHAETFWIALAATTAFGAGAWALARPGRAPTFIVFGLTLTLSASIVAHTAHGTASIQVVDHNQPNLAVLSFDALRKDVLDQRCTSTKSRALKAICERGRRFENVITTGVSTYQVLTRNIHGEARCSDSLPGKLANQGYATAMYLGRRMVNIRGAFCFNRYFSGENRTLVEGFALPSLFSFAAQQSPRQNFRSKYIDTAELFETFEQDPISRHKPLATYFHMLDLHSPYVPTRFASDARYLEAVGEFERRCFTGHCDLKTPADARLVERMKEGYMAALEDLEKNLDAIFSFYESRGRKFKLVLTADHGELFGEHDGILHGGAFVPELLSVPFIVYDSEAAEGTRDCRLMPSDEALHETFGLLDKPTGGPRKRLDVDGTPLGRAVVDAERETIEFSISPGAVPLEGTWRNLHRSSAGTLPFPHAHCD